MPERVDPAHSERPSEGRAVNCAKVEPVWKVQHAVSIGQDGYRVVVWCPDCNGVDFEGCFDGGVERHGPFATREEAERAGEGAVGDSIWAYEITEPEAGRGDHRWLSAPNHH